MAGLKTHKHTAVQVLHVDDDFSILEIAKSILTDIDNFEIDHATSVDEAFAKMETKKYDVIISDYEMPQKNGIHFLKEIREKNDATPFILFTGKGREEVAIQALNLGADGYINKQGKTEIVYGELAHAILNLSRICEAERVMQAGEAKFKLYVENSPVAVCVVNVYGEFEYVNQAASKMLGYSVEELQNLSFPQLVFEEDLYNPPQIFSELKAKLVLRQEMRLKSRTGEAVFVDLNAVALPNGKLLAFCENITEKQNYETTLRESEEKFSKIVDSLNEAVILIDREAKIVYCSKAVKKIFGYTDTELLGEIVFTIVPQEILARAKPSVEKFGKTGALPIPEKTIFTFGYRKNQEKFPMELFLTSIQIQGQTYAAGIIRDITERKKVEFALRESEERYRLLYQSAGIGVGYYTVDGYVISYNEVALKYIGKQKSEVVGKSFYDLFPRKDAEVYFNRLASAIRQNSILQFEDKIVLPSGTKWFLSVYSCVKDLNGNISGVQILSVDISDRKKAEEALAESELKYRSLFENSLDGVMLTKPDGTILSANPVACRMLGMSEAEIKQAGREGLVVKDEKLASALKEREMTGHMVANLTYRRKDGTTFVGETSSNVFTDAEGNAKTSIVLRDITERVAAEVALRQSERRFRDFADSLPEIVFETDVDGKVTYVNRMMSETLGFSVNEILGRNCIQFLVPEDRARAKENLHRIFQGEKSKGNEYRVIKKDGQVVPVMIYTTLVQHGETGKLGFSGIIVNISKMKKANQKIEMSNEKLRVVGSFTRHDVANKLSVVQNNLYLLKKRIGGDAELAKYFEQIDAAISTSNRLFEFSRWYERIGVEELVEVGVEACFNQAVSLVPNLEDVRVVNAAEGLVVVADSLLGRVFYNLVDNSLKHGGRVHQIRLSYVDDGEQVRLFYEDDGVGVADEVRGKIFDEGFSTSKSTGLGLHLVRKIVEVYGWVITEQGEEGKGAKFVISIPKRRSS